MNSSPLIATRSLISQTWQRYTQHWNHFIEISWWMLALPVVTLIAVFALTFSNSPVSLTVVRWISVILHILEPLFMLWISIRLTQLALAKDVKQEDLIVRNLRGGWNLFWPMVWLAILMTLAVIGGFVAFVIPGIWLSVALMFASILLIDQNLRGQQALVHSLALVKHRWWPVFWRMVACLFVFGIVVFLAQSVLNILISLVMDSNTLHSINELTRASLFGQIVSVDGLRAEAISHVLEAIPQALFSPLFLISNVILYRSLRETR